MFTRLINYVKKILRIVSPVWTGAALLRQVIGNGSGSTPVLSAKVIKELATFFHYNLLDIFRLNVTVKVATENAHNYAQK